MSFSTVFAKTLNNVVNGFGGYTIRSVVPASQIIVPPGSQGNLFLTLHGASTVLGECWIGHKAASGNPWDFAAAPVQVKLNNSGIIDLGSGMVRLDCCAFEWDGVSDIIVSSYITSGNLRRNTTGPGSHYERSGNYADDLAPTGLGGSGYNPATNTLVCAIEMDGFEEGGGSGEPGTPSALFELFGAIRNTGGVWSRIEDSEHLPLNIGLLEDKGTFLRLHYAQPALSVGYMDADPDETLLPLGYEAGCSVGLTYTDIYFTKNKVPVNPSTVEAVGGNFWIHGKHWK